MNDHPLALIAAAREQHQAAQQALISRQWVPSRKERTVAADLWAAAARPPIPTLKPTMFGQAFLWQELSALSCWAGAARLAMAAGGWTLPDPPHPVADEPAWPLPALLRAVYSPAAMIERWERQQHGRFMAGTGPQIGASDAEKDDDLKSRIPDIEEALQAADDLYWGFGTMTSTLHAVASGDVDE